MTEPAGETAPIVRTVDIAAAPERVFELLIEPAELVRWWPEAAELEPRVGGRVRLAFGGRPNAVTGEVTRFEPPHSFGFTWIREDAPDVSTTVDFTLVALDGGRCRVEVVHGGWRAAPELRDAHVSGWDYFLPRLGAVAEGRQLD